MPSKMLRGEHRVDEAQHADTWRQGTTTQRGKNTSMLQNQRAAEAQGARNMPERSTMTDVPCAPLKEPDKGQCPSGKFPS